jgi:hypothetical protein
MGDDYRQEMAATVPGAARAVNLGYCMRHPLHRLPANAPLPHGEERIRAARQRGPVRVSNHLARCGVAKGGVNKVCQWFETHIDSA